MIDLSSASNPAFRRWLRLAEHPREVRAARVTLAEGEHLAQAAVAAGVPIEAVLVRADAGLDALLARLRIAPTVPVYRLAPNLYDRLAPVEQGIGLMLVILVTPPASAAVTADLLYLDGVQDPGNVGALLRVAAAAGVRQVWSSPGCAALWAPKVLRGAQGAHFALALREGVTPPQLRAEFPGPLFATALEHARPLWQLDLRAPAVGWLLGSEGAGLSAAAMAVADERVRIPVAAAVESLNVATAAAVCLFERQRQLQASPTS